jgi:hypothetical protein
MKESERALLGDVRKGLLNLHKTLLDWERAAYERQHGRRTAGELLNALMSDAQFAWLRPMSELIVRIDESLEIDAMEGPEIDVAAILSQVRTLVSPDANGTPYAQRYYTALQEHPDAVIKHRAVTTLLKDTSPRQP